MRFFIELSYKGTNYHGWQVQPNANTVQAEINKALSLILNAKIEVSGAGRTDAGVHAKQMFAHFDYDAEFDFHTTIIKLNSFLANDIAVRSFYKVRDEASSRFSKANTQTFTNNCNVMLANWQWQDAELVFTIKADRFLRNMVRAIVGTLLEVGIGKIKAEQVKEIIAQNDRCMAGTSVPANALFLSEIEYSKDIFI